MGERTDYAPGTFCWVDLGAGDPDGASAFYGAVLGWRPDPPGPPETAGYRMMRVDDRVVAGIYASGSPGPRAWTSYVSVDDADAVCARARELGADVEMGPLDVMEFGRMASLRDPQGARVALWQAGTMIGAELVNDWGALTVNQLNTPDPAGASAFYIGLFGWEITRIPEAGPAYWGIANGGRLNGGMMGLDAANPAPPHWLPYFTVEDVDASDAVLVDAGGTVVVDVMSAGEGRILVALDPEGAPFALWEGRVDP